MSPRFVYPGKRYQGRTERPSVWMPPEVPLVLQAGGLTLEVVKRLCLLLWCV